MCSFQIQTERKAYCHVASGVSFVYLWCVVMISVEMEDCSHSMFVCHLYNCVCMSLCSIVVTVIFT